MSEFDPDKPGMLVHDQLNDQVIEWQPERHGRDWHQHGHHDWGSGQVEWDELLLDGGGTMMPRRERHSQSRKASPDAASVAIRWTSASTSSSVRPAAT